MVAYVFPGQGSQAKGMGEELFDSVDQFLSNESLIDEILGCSLRELCIDNPGDKLKQTQYTQPCLYVVNALHYFKRQANGAVPDIVAGHSLGEYNALLAAGAFDFMTGFRLVVKRGELMAAAKNGGMAAVLGLSQHAVGSVLRDNNLADIDIANFNEPKQVVISGPVDSIEAASQSFEKAGAASYIPLPVSAAFHSRYMNDAAQKFQQYLTDYSFNPLNIPVVANVTGRPYPAGDPTLVVRAFLVRQISQSVKWTHSIEYMLENGITDLEEVGQGRVLTGLTAKIRAALDRELQPA